MSENTTQSSPEALKEVQKRFMILNLFFVIPSLFSLFFGILSFSLFVFAVIFAGVNSYIALYFNGKLIEGKSFYTMKDSEKIRVYEKTLESMSNFLIVFFLFPYLINGDDHSFSSLIITTVFAIGYHYMVVKTVKI